MTNETTKPDLVFGASGYIGTNLVEFLLAEGRSVRASSRNVEVLRGRGWQGAELCGADALDPEQLDAALQNVDTAYYLVHSMAAGDAFPEIDALAARNFAAAAERQAVRRIVYLGGLTPDNPESVHLQSRQQTGDILRDGAVPVTELRAGMIIGPGSAAWEVIRDLVNHLPVMITPRWVFSRSTPIALSNLLRYLADVPKLDETAGQTYDVACRAGSDLQGNHAALRPAYREAACHHSCAGADAPAFVLLVTTGDSVPTNVARALIGGLTQDVIARDQRLAALIPQELLDFDAAATEALRAERQHALPAHWVESAVACREFSPAYGYYAKRRRAAR